MASNYSSNNTNGDFPIDWNAWHTTSGTVYNPWTITTTGTIPPGWLVDLNGITDQFADSDIYTGPVILNPLGVVPNPLDNLPNPIRIDDAILDSLRIPEEWWIRQIEEQTRTQTEIQQRMAFEAERFGLYNQKKFGKEKKVFPRKPLRMIRIQEDAKKS